MKPKVIVKIRYYKQVSKRCTFYSSAQSDDYMAYVDKGSKAETYDYLEYAGNVEKSAGVFGRNGLLDKLHKKELHKRLRATFPLPTAMTWCSATRKANCVQIMAHAQCFHG